MAVRQTVYETLEEVAREQSASLPPLNDGLVLLDSGLDSLGFAILIARLEGSLGVDPFATDHEAAFPVTLGDLVAAYATSAARADAAG